MEAISTISPRPFPQLCVLAGGVRVAFRHHSEACRKYVGVLKASRVSAGDGQRDVAPSHGSGSCKFEASSQAEV